MSEIQIADWVEKITGDRAPLKDLREWEHRYHHFLPFFGAIDVADEPGEVLTGLGRIVELVQALAHRFQIQEFLVRDIAEIIADRVGAKGVFVRSRAVHLGVHSRGPSDPTMETVCVYAVGSFKPIAARRN